MLIERPRWSGFICQLGRGEVPDGGSYSSCEYEAEVLSDRMQGSNNTVRKSN